MPIYSFSISLALVAAARFIAAQNSITVHLPSAVPTDAAGPVDPAFVGLAFEQADFYWYAFDSATGGPNAFSQNLVDSISKRTQSTPILRVGGTTGDKGRFNTSLDLPVPRKNFGNATVPNLRCKSAEECLQLGPSYFDAFEQFKGVKYMFMVPQMPPHLPNTLQWTKAGLEAIGDNLEVIEIGNEPDLAFPNYSPKSFSKSFNKFGRAITAQHPGRKKKLFQALDVSYIGGPGLSPQQAQDAGLNYANTSQVAYHYYGKISPDDSLAALQNSIANHNYLLQGDNNNHGMDVYTEYVKQAHIKGLDFVFSEVGTDGGDHTFPKGQRKRRNNMATTLWNVDFMLHSMALGVDRVNMQTCESFSFSLWQPNPSKFSDVRKANALFYALPFVADFIGKAGNLKVKELNTHEDGRFVTYAAYNGNNLARVAVLNLDLWSPSNGTRPVTEVMLSGLPTSIKSGKAHFLAAIGGAYDTEPTWDGLRWDDQGHEVQMIDDSETISVTNGAITLRLNSTTAAVIDFA